MNFNEYSQHLKDANIPTLGMLAWYYVPDSAEIPHAELLQLVETSNAPIKAPQVPKPADVFRRACNNAKTLKARSSQPDVFFNYTMRDAGYDNGFVFRIMVEEKVDSKNHSLGFRTLGLVSFSKSGVIASYSKEIDDSDEANVYWNSMRNKIDEYIRVKMLYIPAIAVRESARKALEVHLLGTRVRPGGGVYFVAIDKAEKLEALDYVINSVENSSFHILPLIDDSRQREMLKESFEDESVEEATRMISDITELLKSDNHVPAKTFIAFQERYNYQKLKMSEYSTLLNDALDKSQAALDICNAQIIALLDRAS
jgi:hypothetical protein